MSTLAFYLPTNLALSFVLSPFSAIILSRPKGGLETLVDFLGPGSRSRLRLWLANQIAE